MEGVLVILLIFLPLVVKAIKAYKKAMLDIQNLSEEQPQAEVPSAPQSGNGDYFTYESDENVKSSFGDISISRPSPQTKVLPEVEPFQSAIPDFDLRTAVIYETILRNDYLTDMNN